MSEAKTILISAEKICGLYPRSKLDPLKVRSICQLSGIRSQKEGYEVFPATDAIIAFYKSGYETKAIQGDEDLVRKRKADADSAEVMAAKIKGQTLLKKDVELIWADYFAQQREALAHMPGITDKQRRVVSEKLLAIKISEDISK